MAAPGLENIILLTRKYRQTFGSCGLFSEQVL